jgi:hypothetical protein
VLEHGLGQHRILRVVAFEEPRIAAGGCSPPPTTRVFSSKFQDAPFGSTESLPVSSSNRNGS